MDFLFYTKCLKLILKNKKSGVVFNLMNFSRDYVYRTQCFCLERHEKSGHVMNVLHVFIAFSPYVRLPEQNVKQTFYSCKFSWSSQPFVGG